MGDKEDLGFSHQEVEALEKDFQEILNELAGDQTLERFKLEYTKLYTAFKSSYENERKLLRRLKDINNDIIGNAGTLQTAIKLSQDDSQTIQYLKAELEKTFKVLEASKEREDKSKSKIENLTAEIKHLNSLIEQGNALASQTSRIQELVSKKEELQKERDNLNSMLISSRQEINSSVDRLKQLEHEKLNLENNCKSLRKSLMEMDEKVNKDEDRRKKISEELDQLRKNFESARNELEKQINERGQIQQKSEEFALVFKDKENIKENIVKEIKQQVKELYELRKNQDEQNQMKGEYETERKKLDEQLIKMKQALTLALTKMNQVEKHNDKLRNRITMLKESTQHAQKDKEIAINAINQLERQVLDTKSLNFEDRNLIDELRRAHEILNNELSKGDSINNKLSDEISILEKNIEEREKEIYNRSLEVDKRVKKLQSLEKEKEKYGKQAAQINAKFFHSQEEIKLKDNLISEFQKKNIETEAKLKQQQNLYEAVRSDRNLYSKNLSETQDEIAEIKRRYRIVNHQISQLKEEIDAKEVALAKEHFEHKKKDKTIEEQSRILEKNRKDIEEKEEKIKNFVGEISKLHFIIKDSEIQRQKLKEEYELVVAERDILGTQLIRRNDESALLYEKIKIQQQTLAKGEQQYRERLSDIELLKYKISDLMRELKLFRKSASQIPTLKNEIHNFQNNMIEEKLKVKALSEELENPLNAHRCRKLDGSDPDVYEMKQKIQTLQRRLIYKTEQVVEKEVMIQQKEKQILEMREIMRRQPGLEDAEKISKLQEQIKSKTRQMKSIAAELNMFQAQVIIEEQYNQKINEYKFEIERLTKEIQETNRKYLEHRKREQIQKEQEQLVT